MTNSGKHMQGVGITTTPPVLQSTTKHKNLHDNQPSLKTYTAASSRRAEGVASATPPLNKCKKTQTDGHSCLVRFHKQVCTHMCCGFAVGEHPNSSWCVCAAHTIPSGCSQEDCVSTNRTHALFWFQSKQQACKQTNKDKQEQSTHTRA